MGRGRTLAVLLVLALVTVAPQPTGAAAGGRSLDLSDQVVMRLAAVAETSEGLVGSSASATITVASNGSGHVFLDTFPLTQVDMQGSARLAARVAAQVAGVSLDAHDFFFVIRSESEQIGGPSAGATLAVGAIAALNGWEVRQDAMMTGTINPDGTVGPVGGIPEKAAAAAQIGVRRFLFPEGQETVPVQGDPRVRVDLVRYCEEQLSIECIAVGDVRDAVGLMTDYVIERPPVTGNVTGPLFQETIGPLSRDLVDQAARLVEEARDAVAQLPEGNARAGLAARLAAANATLERAYLAAANGTYYTASSLSFQAAIEAHAVRDIARFVDEGAPALRRAMDAAEDAVAAARRDVDATPVQGTGRFESAGAAQSRLLQAEESLRRAEALAGQGGLDEAIQALDTAAFAAERADTARWWLRLGETLPAGEPLSREQMESAARDTYTASQEVVAYVEAVFGAAQGAIGGGATLTSSRDKLQEAREAMDRGYYAGAMLLALEGETRASALLKIATYANAVPDSVFEQARVTAARAIHEARARGVEPLLAQSVYEFSFAQEDAVERLAFLGMARVAANLAGLPGAFSDAPTSQSRFQGVPDVIGFTPGWVAAAFAVGIAMGAGVGLAALMPRDPAEESAEAEREASIEETRERGRLRSPEEY